MSAVFFIFWVLIVIAQLSLILLIVFDVIQFDRKYPSKKKEKTHPGAIISPAPIDDLFNQSEIGKMSIEEYNLRRRVLVESMIKSNGKS